MILLTAKREVPGDSYLPLIINRIYTVLSFSGQDIGLSRQKRGFNSLQDCHMAPSSSGLGYRVFIPTTGFRIPEGSPFKDSYSNDNKILGIIGSNPISLNVGNSQIGKATILLQESCYLYRSDAVVAILAHNQKVVGSNPTSGTSSLIHRVDS